jgi:hypothetical protein
MKQLWERQFVASKTILNGYEWHIGFLISCIHCWQHNNDNLHNLRMHM